MKQFLTIALLVVLSVGSAFADVIVTGTITQNTTWTANNVYLLRGAVFVGDDVNTTVLTIQPGTLVRGERASGGYLVIRRHSRIEANGTATQPIVFTSDQPSGFRARGDWGGIVINGLSHVNLAGGVGQGEGNSGEYGGGANPIENDNSGTLRYVRVEYAGYPVTPEDELNGIAFQGVGSGTTVDYVQIHMGGDDGIEMFGGSVNVKHIIVTGALDDQFDYTFGWNGYGQFWISQQYGDAADMTWECDNNEFNHEATPRSHPVVANVTFVGAANESGIKWRRGTAGELYNAIIMNNVGSGKAALDIDDISTYNNSWNGTSLNGQLQLNYGMLYNCTNWGDPDNDTGAPYTEVQFLDGTAGGGMYNMHNQFGVNPMLAAAADTANPDFAPLTGSPVFNTTSYMDPTSINSWFSAVDYCGAVGTVDWTEGWTLFGGEGSIIYPMTLSAGWNLISLPVIPDNNSLSVLFPNATAAYGFAPASGYTLAANLLNGKGYWVNNSIAETVTLVGASFNSYTSSVTPPWELMGAVDNTDVIPTVNQGTINVMYSFNPLSGYVAATDVDHGKGYWMNFSSEVTQLTVGGVVDQANQTKASLETDEIWNLALTATGQTGTAPNVFTVNIGGGDMQNLVPAPPAPPSYMSYVQLYDENWAGPYATMNYVWPSSDSILWILEVDPNGNVTPPVSRTTTVSWNPALLPSTGTFYIMDGVSVVVADMRLTSSFSCTGTQLKYYQIIGIPPAAPVPDVEITLTPAVTPIVVPAAGGNFTYTINIHNNTTSVQHYDFWSQIVLPSFGSVSVLTMQDMAIGAGGNLSRARVQTVPGFAPAGEYTYYGFIGDYPWIVDDFDCFNFTKLGTADGTLGSTEAWVNEEAIMTSDVEVLSEYTLFKSYPNPFNPTTTISFNLPEVVNVELSIFDINGRLVETLVDGMMNAGSHQIVFNAADLSTGVYFVQLNASDFSATDKLLLVK